MPATRPAGPNVNGVPGVTACVEPPVPASVKLNGPPPAGVTDFATVIVGRFVFVNVHVTVSPGSTLIAPTGDPSEHVDVRRAATRAGVVSATEYVPGAIGPESFDCPSESENPPL